MLKRRDFLKVGALAAGATALSRPLSAFAAPVVQVAPPPPAAPPGIDLPYTPVTVLNGATLPWKLVDGVKVMHLVAEPVAHEFAPGLKATCWGYNGLTPGPVIELVEGDSVRIYVTNRLPEGTTVHWHGILLPSGMDGVGGLTQPLIEPGETFRYEFTIRQHGTFMYHPHADEMVQIGMGMMGMIVVHPRQPTHRIDRDFCFMLSEWAMKPGTTVPDTGEMTDYNILTLNSRAYPGTAPMVVQQGDHVKMRFGNLSAMDHHPIHLHGYNFKIVETDGGQIPEAGQWPETTVLVPTGSTRAVEFTAEHPGDWAMHCHMIHHIMNQMGHGLPNLIGADVSKLNARMRAQLGSYMTMGERGMAGMGDHMQMMNIPPNTIPMLGGEGPYAYIDMGGMFTILKVREHLEGVGDPGWYTPPPGTLARIATADELLEDGIAVPPLPPV